MSHLFLDHSDKTDDVPDYRLIIAGVSSLDLFLSAEIPKQPAPPTVTSKNELIVHLDSLQHRYGRAARAVGLANWHSYANDAPFDLDSAKAKLAAVVAEDRDTKNYRGMERTFRCAGG